MVPASEPGLLRVTVALVTPEVQELVPVDVPAGATVAQAIARARLVERYGLDLARLQVAVYGQRRRLDDAVGEGDRIELLRPLVADPKEARRARAKAGQPTSGRSRPTKGAA
jgi:putative ubiquitin-RnfH superfamily antitoxin RatB of RatAB toxin-antitoxin module